MGTPITEINVGKARLDSEIEEQQEVANKEFTAITQTELIPPPQALPRAFTPELAPDNMASRIPGLLATKAYSLVPEEVSFDRMRSRIMGSSVIV
jgi:hypothetical protein